jgi:hypothetical protein
MKLLPFIIKSIFENSKKSRVVFKTNDLPKDAFEFLEKQIDKGRYNIVEPFETILDLDNKIIEISSNVLDNINYDDVDLFAWIKVNGKGELIDGGFDK